MKRLFAMLLALIVTLSVAACRHTSPDDPTKAPEPTPIPGSMNTESPSAEPTQSASAADIEFAEMDKKLFVSSVIRDGLTYHQYVKDPASFGIDEAEVERGWGDESYAAYLNGVDEDKKLLNDLNSIDYASLSDYNKLAYDNIKLILEQSLQMGDTYYYEEPLLPLNGIHSMLPLMLTLYEINGKQDVDNYLTLLEDSARYLGQIEQFEIEKANKGLFMTENALDQVLETCNKYVKEGKNFFLIEFFEKTIGENELGISNEDKQAYLSRNEKYIIDELLPAYEKLANTLDSLRSKCMEFSGAVNRGEDALKWYKYDVQQSGACFYDISEIEKRLKNLCESTYVDMIGIMQNNPNIYNHYFDSITSGNAESDVEYLESLITDIYPSLQEQEIDFLTVPEAVADDFSPAAYLISAFDDPSRNVVMFNPSADTSTLLFTLAHECFPGHLYQTQYFRQLEGLSLSQQLIAPTGYTEGWAVFSEVFIADYASDYDAKTCKVKQLESTLFNVLIPAYVSLKINMDGWTDDQVGAYLDTYSINQDGYRDVLYEYAVDMPTYFFNYALGYMNTKLIYDGVNPNGNAENLEFFTEYLNYGPCAFNILFDKFNISF